VLIHGWSCDGNYWKEQIAPLKAKYTTVTVDLAGHGASGANRTDWSMGNFGEDVAAVARQLQNMKIVLVGHSMGGMLALHAQRAAPERIAALALLSSSARADTAELLRLRSDAIVEFEHGRTDDVLRANAMFAFHPRHAADRTRVDDYVAQILRIGPLQLIAQNRAVMARADMRPWLAAIACPLLLACGDDDRLTPLEHSREIAQAVPHAPLEVVPHAGHLLPWEQPERVNALLLQWLAAVASPR